MKLIFIGYSIRTSALVLLYVNVVANSYNLMLISMYCDRQDFVKLLGNDVAYNWYLIMMETILMLISIVLMNKKSYFGATISIKYWLYGLIVVTLSLEILAAVSFGILLCDRNAVDKFWIERETYVRNKHAPVHVHLLVAGLLVGFVACKLYSAGVLFIFGSNVANHTYCEDDNDIEQGPPSHDEQIERLPSFLPHPPPYDFPPRYSEVFKD